MNVTRLDFLNKNMYRKYPIRASSTHTFTNGAILPLGLITSAQITTTYDYYQIYISQVYVNNNIVNITVQDAGTNLILGCFSGQITQDQQVLTMQPFNNVTTGVITIGSVVAANQLSGMNFFTAANGRLEDSTIYCFTPPAVTSISNEGNSATGAVKLAGVNLSFSESTPNITLDVIDKTQILANANFSSVYNNCPSPLVTQINSVFPTIGGNIDIYGVSPVAITVASGDVVISLGDLTLGDVCPEKNLITPPDNNSNTYYDDILTSTTPEWKTWPQFS